jgi:hypothetical protein
VDLHGVASYRLTSEPDVILTATESERTQQHTGTGSSPHGVSPTRELRARPKCGGRPAVRSPGPVYRLLGPSRGGSIHQLLCQLPQLAVLPL